CLLFDAHADRPDRLSFPTRRSSDLVMVFDPMSPQAVQQSGFSVAADLDELLTTCDIVSLHCPLTNETRKLIDASRLSQMKPNALDRKSTRLNSSHVKISYAVFCLKK